MKLQKSLIAIFSVFVLTVAGGCPDRSYMRPEPDWTKQGDDSKKGDDNVDNDSRESGEEH